MEGAGGALLEGDGALPSSRLAAPLKGTKLGSAASGSDVLSAKHNSILDSSFDLRWHSHVSNASVRGKGYLADYSLGAA